MEAFTSPNATGALSSKPKRIRIERPSFEEGAISSAPNKPSSKEVDGFYRAVLLLACLMSLTAVLVILAIIF